MRFKISSVLAENEGVFIKTEHAEGFGLKIWGVTAW